MDDGRTQTIIMDQLPLEIINLIAFKYLKSPIDQLAFIITSSKHYLGKILSLCQNSSSIRTVDYHFMHYVNSSKCLLVFIYLHILIRPNVF